MSNASSGYTGIMRLARERPDWLPIAEACVRCVKTSHGEFAGKWVLQQLGTEWAGLRFGDGKARWFPGLRTLVAYGILKHEDTVRGGRRAYYSMPDAEGVEEALKELGYLRA